MLGYQAGSFPGMARPLPAPGMTAMMPAAPTAPRHVDPCLGICNPSRDYSSLGVQVDEDPAEMAHLRAGHEQFVQAEQFRYAGSDYMRVRSPWCLLAAGVGALALVCIPLLSWFVIRGGLHPMRYDCYQDVAPWTSLQQDYCCMKAGRGCGSQSMPELSVFLSTTPFLAPQAQPVPMLPPPPTAAPMGVTFVPSAPAAAAAPVAAAPIAAAPPAAAAAASAAPAVEPANMPAAAPAAVAGAVAAPSVGLFDCDEDFDAWQSKWTFGKKVWCCEHFKKGCMK